MLQSLMYQYPNEQKLHDVCRETESMMCYEPRADVELMRSSGMAEALHHRRSLVHEQVQSRWMEWSWILMQDITWRILQLTWKIRCRKGRGYVVGLVDDNKVGEEDYYGQFVISHNFKENARRKELVFVGYKIFSKWLNANKSADIYNNCCDFPVGKRESEQSNGGR